MPLVRNRRPSKPSRPPRIQSNWPRPPKPRPTRLLNKPERRAKHFKQPKMLLAPASSDESGKALEDLRQDLATAREDARDAQAQSKDLAARLHDEQTPVATGKDQIDSLQEALRNTEEQLQTRKNNCNHHKKKPFKSAVALKPFKPHPPRSIKPCRGPATGT